MSLLNENISIKIKEIRFMSWNESKVSVAARRYHAIAFRLLGRGEFTGGGLSFSSGENDILYMPAGYTYNAIYPEKNKILVIHFESDLKSAPKNYKLNNPGAFARKFQKMNEIWNRKEPGYYIDSLLMLCELLKELKAEETNRDFLSDSLKSFEESLIYMEENYRLQDFSVDKMIECAAVSGTYFRRLFKERFGTSPAKYILKKRLFYAEKLLSDSKCTVADAAEKAGFSDVKYFARACKNEFGVPPSQLYSHKKI